MPAIWVSHRSRDSVSDVTPSEAVCLRQDLRSQIRACKLAVSSSLLTMTTPKFWNATSKRWRPSPIRQWQNAIKCPHNRQRAKAERQLAALEEKYPTPADWKPRPATATDKRIAKQYDATATPIMDEIQIVMETDDARRAFRQAWRERHYDGTTWVRDRGEIPVRDYLRELMDLIRLAECGIVPRPDNEVETEEHPEREEQWSEELDRACAA